MTERLGADVTRLRWLRVFSGLLLVRCLSALAQALILFVLARELKPHEFAFAMGALGILTFLSALTDLGVTPATTRDAAAGSTARVLGLMRLNSSIAVAAGTLCAATLLLSWMLTGQDNAWLQLLPFAIWLVFERLGEFRFALDLGRGAEHRAMLNVIIRRCTPALFVCAAPLVPARPVLLLSVGFAVGATLAVCVASWNVGKGVPSPSALPRSQPRDTVQVLKTAMPFWLNSVAAQSRQLDVSIVSLLTGGGTSAAYAPAARLINPLRLIPSTLAQASLPQIARSMTTGVKPWPLLLSSMAMSVAVYAAVAAAAVPLTGILLGSGYSGVPDVLRVLLVGLVFASGTSVLTSYLQGTSHEWDAAGAALVVAALSLAALGIGASVSGAVGAAAGLALGYMVHFFLALGLVLRVVRGRLEGNAYH